ncbi:MAG: hypothetical protein H0T59_06575 [Chloroflexi bacterium]|nr:hypothetical protein [Chloroflexota bacterium]
MDSNDSNKGLTDDQRARGIPTKDGLMDPGIDTTMGGSKTTINPPAGLESEIDGVGAHGAVEGDADAPTSDEAKRTAQEGVKKAFRSDR